MKARPVEAENRRIAEKAKPSGKKCKYDLRLKKTYKPYQKERKKYLRYVVENDLDMRHHIRIASDILTYIYEHDVRKRSIFNIPSDLRDAGLAPSTVYGLSWQHAHKNRSKKGIPEGHLIVFGKYTECNFTTRRIEILRENISIPMPIEFTDQRVITWIKIYLDTSEIVTKDKPTYIIPDTLEELLGTAVMPKDDEGG